MTLDLSQQVSNEHLTCQRFRPTLHDAGPPKEQARAAGIAMHGRFAQPLTSTNHDRYPATISSTRSGAGGSSGSNPARSLTIRIEFRTWRPVTTTTIPWLAHHRR